MRQMLMRKYPKVAVVIDVFRAFTTACHIIKSKPSEYFMVSSCVAAMNFKNDRTDALLIGKPEIGSNLQYHIPNSPTLVSTLEINDRPVIHRTSSGAAGAIKYSKNRPTIGVCFANLKASHEWLCENADDFEVYPMGLDSQTPSFEDNLCMKALLGLFKGQTIDIKQHYQELKVGSGRYFFNGNQKEYPASDFEYCLSLNSHRFPLVFNSFSDHVRITCG